MLSEILKELRSQKNVTQDDMANLLNIKRQTYSAYERGVSFPDLISLIKIAEFFGVTTDYLLGYKKDNYTGIPVSEQMHSLIKSYSDLNEDELKKVIEYIEFIKTKRKN